MPYKPSSIEKKYFTIGEVAKQFKVATSLIRFWESEFEFIKPSKDSQGNRKYTVDDIDKFKTVYQLVKMQGYTLSGAKDMLRADVGKAREQSEIIDSLKKLRAFLVELKTQLDEEEQS